MNPAAGILPAPTVKLRQAAVALTMWPSRRWAAAFAGAVGTALLVGLPTAVIPNPVFGRSVATEWWAYPALALTSVLAGIVLATYVRSTDNRGGRLGSVGGVLSFLAVGCPVCNKVVLLALGTSGAMSYWAPLQPLLGVASLTLLAIAAVQRLSGEVACPAG